MPASTIKVNPDSAGEKQPSRLILQGFFTTDETDETTMRFYATEAGSVASGTWE